MGWGLGRRRGLITEVFACNNWVRGVILHLEIQHDAVLVHFIISWAHEIEISLSKVETSSFINRHPLPLTLKPFLPHSY